MSDGNALQRWQKALVRSAIEHAGEIRTGATSRLSGTQTDILLGRLGLCCGAAFQGAVPPADTATDRDRRQSVVPRLRLEWARQLRFARAGNPRYDLNRHLALHRLIETITGVPGKASRGT